MTCVPWFLFVRSGVRMCACTASASSSETTTLSLSLLQVKKTAAALFSILLGL